MNRDEQTQKDLSEDIESLQYILEDALGRLHTTTLAIKGHPERFQSTSSAMMQNHADALLGVYTKMKEDLNALQTSIAAGARENSSVLYRSLKDQLRTLQGQLGEVLNACRWQSPAFLDAGSLQIGIETGSIAPAENDYKRDYHDVGHTYAKAFVSQYVDYSYRLPPFAYTTSSGMSALTTVALWILPRLSHSGVVLVGNSLYFQNKLVIAQMFGEKIIWGDDTDTEGFLALAELHKPAAVFLSTFSTTEACDTADLHMLIPKLSHLLNSKSVVVLDNTIASATYQPLRDLPVVHKGMHMVVIESLLKNHQFGFDLVNGGIIWAPFGSEPGLFETRMNAGTILAQQASLTLPTPDRKQLEHRLLRIGRNAQFLATEITYVLGKAHGAISHVAYPGLASHPAYRWAKDNTFNGGFFTLVFKDNFRTLAHYDRLVKNVVKTAQRKGVVIASGTSFGFDTTRIYVVARNSVNTEPFIRVSVGIETADEIEKIKEVFFEALRLD